MPNKERRHKSESDSRRKRMGGSAVVATAINPAVAQQQNGTTTSKSRSPSKARQTTFRSAAKAVHATRSAFQHTSKLKQEQKSLSMDNTNALQIRTSRPVTSHKPFNNSVEVLLPDAIYTFADSLISTVEIPIIQDMGILLMNSQVIPLTTTMGNGGLPPDNTPIISIDCGDNDDTNHQTKCCTVSKKVCENTKEATLLRKILNVVRHVVESLVTEFFGQFTVANAATLNPMNIMKGVLYSYTIDFILEKYIKNNPTLTGVAKVLTMTYVMASDPMTKTDYFMKAAIGFVNKESQFMTLNKKFTGLIVDNMHGLAKNEITLVSLNNKITELIGDNMNKITQ